MSEKETNFQVRSGSSRGQEFKTSDSKIPKIFDPGVNGNIKPRNSDL